MEAAWKLFTAIKEMGDTERPCVQKPYRCLHGINLERLTARRGKWGGKRSIQITGACPFTVHDIEWRWPLWENIFHLYPLPHPQFNKTRSNSKCEGHFFLKEQNKQTKTPKDLEGICSFIFYLRFCSLVIFHCSTLAAGRRECLWQFHSI